MDNGNDWTMEMHEKDQVTLYHGDDWSSTHPFQSHNKLNYYFINTIENRKLKKANYNCSEDNSVKITPCLANYWSKKIGCRLPWSKYIPSHDALEVCAGREKFTKLRALMLNAFGPTIRQELVDEGCFQPNCIQRSWSIQWHREMPTYPSANETQFLFYLPQSDVVVRREIKLYTIVNLFAEVGGYLGLLLGASLFSYCDEAWEFMTMVHNKRK